jgi:hypothetical protein
MLGMIFQAYAVAPYESCAKTAEELARDFSLTGVDVLPSPLSGTRKIVDIIVSYTNRNTDFTEKFCVRVDATESSRSWSRNCRRTMNVRTEIGGVK